ncbi:hypothetical protein EGW08_021668, partial [Elysia chlorotica]
SARTLRESALQGPAVTRLLQQRFVSSWSIMADLKVHAADSSMRHSSLAQLFVDVYEFPVLMIVALSDGTIVHKMNANDFLDMEMSSVNIGFSDPASQNYYKFLMDGIEKAEAVLKQLH